MLVAGFTNREGLASICDALVLSWKVERERNGRGRKLTQF
jgi:hypothetical protein